MTVVRSCSEPGCSKTYKSRGLCGMHYARLLRSTTAAEREPISVRSTASQLDRFMDKVRKDANGCWLWTAAIGRNGYGRFAVGGDVGPQSAHRVAYEMLVGPIPEGLHIDHLCRVRHCVNPEHLEPVTCRENLFRGKAPAILRRLSDVCAKGHKFTPENAYFTPEGYRKCRTCRSANARRRYAARLQDLIDPAAKWARDTGDEDA